MSLAGYPRGVVRAHVFVSGEVQGVFFRAETRRQASGLSLGGWVRNLPDGRVEAVFEGPRDEVERMVAWAREGPGYARVRDVDLTWEDPEGLTDFEVRRTPADR
jgi:acylphosphatase